MSERNDKHAPGSTPNLHDSASHFCGGFSSAKKLSSAQHHKIADSKVKITGVFLSAMIFFTWELPRVRRLLPKSQETSPGSVLAPLPVPCLWKRRLSVLVSRVRMQHVNWVLYVSLPVFYPLYFFSFCMFSVLCIWMVKALEDTL